MVQENTAQDSRELPKVIATLATIALLTQLMQKIMTKLTVLEHQIALGVFVIKATTAHLAQVLL